MKTALSLAAAAVAALSLAACNKPASTTTTETKSVTTSAVDNAQDAVGAAVGQTSAATVGSHDSGAFVSNASQGDIYEIEAGKIAGSRSRSADIKAFAKMMVTDHTATSKALAPLAAAAGETPADKLDERRQGFIDNLKSAPAADFDKTYVDQQVAAHEEALTLMQGYATGGGDPGLKDAAAKTAPKVQQHLDQIKAIQAAMKS